MRINNVVDERRDPLIASQAAAQFLKANYERLGTWPLAITAYNHGPGGLAAAVDELDTTDIGVIIKYYKGSRFGFASRNFYPEFLAALLIEKNFESYFGPLLTEAPVVHDEITVELPVPLRTAARFAGTDEEELIFLNPALGSSVQAGNASVPRGYDLRIPSGASAGFLKAYEPWQNEEHARLVALERARKARLAALKIRKAKGRSVIVRAKGGRGTSSQVVRADSRARKRRG
jgi:membrane-bound lytic murein transglycosylase D